MCNVAFILCPFVGSLSDFFSAALVHLLLHAQKGASAYSGVSFSAGSDTYNSTDAEAALV